MEQQLIALGPDQYEVTFISDLPPSLIVSRIHFHLTNKTDRGSDWSQRLMGSVLRYHCRLVDTARPLMQMASISDQASIGAQITPRHVQPIIDFGQYWRFQAPVEDKFHRIAKPQWETRLWLDGFAFEEGESATVHVMTNAPVVAPVVH